MFNIVQEIFPIIGPALPDRVPDSWTRLIIILVHSSHINLAIKVHVDIHIFKQRLVRNVKVIQQPGGELDLQVETILHPLRSVLCVLCNIIAMWEGEVDP